MKKWNRVIVYGFLATTVIYAGSPLLVHAVNETTGTIESSRQLNSSELQQVDSFSTETNPKTLESSTTDSTLEQTESTNEVTQQLTIADLSAYINQKVKLVPNNDPTLEFAESENSGAYLDKREALINQSYVFHASEDGWYTIQNSVTQNYLTELSNENKVAFAPLQNYDNQQWRLVNGVNGTFLIQSKLNQFLEINNENGLHLVKTSSEQGWRIDSLPTSSSSQEESDTSVTEVPSNSSESKENYSEKTTPVNIVTTAPIGKTQMKVTISNPNGGNVTRVQFPTWSSTNGQDDLQWLQGTRNTDGSYSVVVNADEYKHDGLFITDIYGTIDGKMQKLGETTTYNLEKSPANIITTTPIGKTQMKVTISNPNGGNVTRVQFPTWSNTNGQDDIRWLQGTRNADGSYSVVVNADEYKHDGLFITDIYGTVDGKMQKLGETTTYNLEKSPANIVTTTPIGKTQMKVTISNPNGGNVTRVQFPTWSNTNGQDDIRWLQGTRNADGSYSVVVNADEYKHDGLFITDIYGTVNGQLQKLGGTTYSLEKTPNIITTTSMSKTKMKISISNPNGGNVTRVQFPTWSNTNGQDDLQWLQGTRNADGSYSVEVDSANFKHGGLFITDIYGTVNGQLQKLGGTRYNLEQQDDVAIRLSKKPYYYSQLDSRWSGLRYGMSTLGPSGCVPTSMAMVLKGHFGVNVTPVDTANRIYSYGGFNQGYFGASGTDLVRGLNSYGRSVTTINSLAELNNYLSKGYPVIMFVNVGIGHAVVAHGYSNGGYTTVYDPYGKQFYNGTVATGTLWSTPSKDSIDWSAGRPYFVIR